ncbi:cox cluster protein [Natronoarchaeum sp. GCM10025321]|uniref:DUF7541 family protein n=2 Tax=unclassified Natronoarchaeum TaxID=2620183 RepID=UPI0036140544
MNEEPGLSDQYRKSSPWPMLIALGIVFSEVGIVLALFPVAVGGLVLLLGSIGGILRETEYVSSPWPVFFGLSVVLVAVGMSLFSFAGGTISQSLTISAADSSIALRGLSIAAAGLVGAVLAPILRSRLRTQPSV